MINIQYNNRELRNGESSANKLKQFIGAKFEYSLHNYAFRKVQLPDIFSLRS